MRAGTIVSLALAALLTAAPSFEAEAKTKVVIGEQTWTGATAIQYVLKVIMEKYLDADVGSIAAGEPVLWEAMDRGDGSVDVLPDVWSEHLPEQLNKYVVPGSRETVILNTKPYLGREGIYVPGYVQDQYGIKKVTDLADPEKAKLFDSDGDGKGEWWAGAVGWEATNHSEVRAKSYGFDKYFTATTVEQPVFLAQLDAAITKKQPILFYYWEPEWIFAVFDLRKLEEPAFDGYTTDDYKGNPNYKKDGCYTFYQPNVAPDWLEKSRITCDQPPTHVYIGHSKELANRAPDISKFLRQVALDGDTVNQWILAIDREKKQPEDVARAWVEANKAKVEGEWLKDVPHTQ
jgi:glycine betaine/proline transport system substrate-binding protein